MGPYHSESPPGLASGTSFGEHVQGPPRKKMRKGTKSCLECRRRKIKCTFEPGSTAVCKECYARGSTCIDQEHGDIQPLNSTSDQAYSLRERVTHLEGMVREVLSRLPDGRDRRPSASSSANADTQSAAEVLKSLRDTSTLPPQETSLFLPSGLREDAPALSLFDNAVITRRDEPPQISRDRYNKNKALTQALTSMLPPARELDIILDVSDKWWTVWRKMFPEISDRRCNTIKESISHSLRSENPAEVAKMILCIAISIDQLPGDWDFSQLHLEESPRELIKRYIGTVDQLITADDEIAGTIDGIECMCLQAKYYINIGRPRRAWLVFRRAIGFAQLLGLHRLALMKTAKPDLQHTRLISLWSHLFQGDRYISLTLGLPVTISSQFCDPCIPPIGQPTDLPEGDVVVLRVSQIVAKIVDRNQNPSLDFSLTLRIDQDMEELAKSVSSGWWGNTDTAAPSLEEHVDRLMSQFFFHQVRQLLHLPFMLKSSTDRRYHYSYTAALDSSRDMIRFYDALRGNDSAGPFMCKLIDFQAFSAAMLILLNLYGYSDGSQKNTEQDQKDSALVDTTIEILRKASKEAGGIVAAQSLKALEMIAEARHGCPGGKETETVKVSIPYFGTVTIAAGKYFNVPKEGTYPRASTKSQQQDPSSRSTKSIINKTNTSLHTPPSGPNSQFSPPASLPTDPSSSSRSASASMLPSPYTTNSISYSDPSSSCPQDQQSQSHQQQQPNNVSTSEDPLISFDSYMTFPPGAGIGFSTTTGTGTSTGSGSGASDQFHTDLTPGLEVWGEQNGMGLGGGLGGGFPWLYAGLDLDASWGWFGAEAPVGVAGGQDGGVRS